MHLTFALSSTIYSARIMEDIELSIHFFYFIIKVLTEWNTLDIKLLYGGKKSSS